MFHVFIPFLSFFSKAASLTADQNPPAAGAGPLQIARLSDQAALAADDPQLVLVGRCQVDGARGDGGAQVAGTRDVQVGQNLGTSQRTGRERGVKTSFVCSCVLPGRVLPQGGVALDLDDVQRVEVGDKQVGLPVGCNT